MEVLGDGTKGGIVATSADAQVASHPGSSIHRAQVAGGGAIHTSGSDIYLTFRPEVGDAHGLARSFPDREAHARAASKRARGGVAPPRARRRTKGPSTG
jgi:hypothetical protein